MQLGEQVRGLMMNRHWRFVISDAHKVGESLIAHDRNVRLVAHDETHQLSVARFIEREHLGDKIDDLAKQTVTERGGAYMLVFHPKNPDGSLMHGEPDATILEQLRQRDLWARSRGVNEKQILNDMEAVHSLREAKAAERILEKLTASTEERLFGYAQRAHLDWAPGRIYVPPSVLDKVVKKREPASAGG